ncbi:uncharacterized protein LOC121053237 [Oryza brachyantha]|uniref:uncharacterized protein LOC121053237 n=1 Tax=Oryza brachyantha TaxID=4533 RepID=UPI001ADC3F6B|nr:uncharacterized protein LOC121053237 [Oryza brachyantha]
MAHGGSPDEKRSASLEALNAKAKVLATRHDVHVAMVYPGDNGEQQYWPSRELVQKIYFRYRKLPEKDRKEYPRSVTQNQADLARELLRSIDDSLAAVSDRIRELQPPQDVDEVEQQLILLEQPDSFMVESQDHGSGGSDAQDMDRENAMPVEEESAVPGEDVVMRDQVEQTQPPLHDAAAPPPVSADGVVPHDGDDGIEYVNLGAFTVTRDAFEAVWREEGRPVPPSNPESMNRWAFFDDERPVVYLSKW